MVMQVVIIAKAVDIGPALQMPVDLLVDATVVNVAHHSMIDAVSKP